MEQLNKESDAYAIVMGGRLAKVREYANMTQHELAAILGTTQNLIYRLEKGQNVSIEMFRLIALYFIRKHKVSYEWLFNPDADDESTPMITNEQIQRHRTSDKQNAERLALLTQFMDDIKKMEK